MREKQDAWKKGLSKAALALLSARKRAYSKDREKVFPSRDFAERASTDEYVREFLRLNNLIP